MQMTDDEADRLSRILERLVRRMRAWAVSDRLRQAGASALGRLDEEGPLGITQLARSEGVSQPAMTQLVDRLCADGLVERRVPEGDRRSVRVRITDAGAAVMHERRARRAARLGRALHVLDTDDRVAIAAALPALERLVEVIAAESADAGSAAPAADSAQAPGPASGPARQAVDPAADSEDPLEKGHIR